MMVGNDDFHSQFICTRHRLNVSDTGVHRDDEFYPASRKLLNAVNVYAVALKVAVRDIIFKICPRFRKKVVHEDSPRATVAVIVAPKGNSLSGANRPRKSL